MDQTKLYAIILTAVLLLWWPAWYFFTTQWMTLEIQEKDESLKKALTTLKKAKNSIEKKDDVIKTQSWEILTCNEIIEGKDKEISSIKTDLENAYAWISDDVISTESNFISPKKEETLEETLDEKVVQNNEDKNITSEKESEVVLKVDECPVCEKSVEKIVIKKSSWNSFDEKIELETMDLAYNKWLWKKWLPYVPWDSKTLLEMFNWEDEILTAKVWYYCGDDYLKKDYYWTSEKAIVRSYVRAYCEDEKYENCSSVVKEKIDTLKSSENILGSNVVRILTKYNEDYTEVNQEMFAVYNNFWARVCSWVRNTSSAWKLSYIQIR